MKKAQLDHALPQGARHHLYLRRGHGRSHTLQIGWVEELPRRQESSCWTGYPNYYQEHPPPRLEDDDRLRYHLELHVCVPISSRTTCDDRHRYHLELHMMIVVDMTLYCLGMHVDYT